MTPEIARHFAEIFQAIADGKEVEFKLNYPSDAPWVTLHEHHEVDDLYAYTYRIKPIVVATYRVALLHDDEYWWTNTYDNREIASEIESLPTFVRWLTDWTEVTK